MAIDRRLREAGDRLRQHVDGPVPPFALRPAPRPAPGRRLRPLFVAVTAAGLVAAAIAVAWTRGDGGSVVATGDGTTGASVSEASEVTATFPPTTIPVDDPATTAPTAPPDDPGSTGRVGDPPIGGTMAVPAAAGPSPEADAQIEAAVQVLFAANTTEDQKLALVDRPDGLREVMERGLADPRQATLVTQVDSITYPSADRALLTLSFGFFGGTPSTRTDTLGGSYTLGFVRTTAGWQADRTSYCELVATGALPCPPEQPTTTTG